MTYTHAPCELSSFVGMDCGTEFGTALELSKIGEFTETCIALTDISGSGGYLDSLLITAFVAIGKWLVVPIGCVPILPTLGFQRLL